MNRTAVAALIIALLLPFAGYFIVKNFSKTAVHMPPRYFYDSVLVTEKSGKTTYDTVWHKIKSIPFTNQHGKPVSIDDAKRKILVIDFFFTHCPSICPGLAKSMKKLQHSFEKNDSIVQFISISVDPERDSVPNLRRFADRFDANQDNWWFVTGNKKEIYDFAFNDLKASIADTNVDTAFIHTELFFLVDSARVVRGFYNGFDSVKMAQLARDIPTLMLEKDRKRPSILRQFIPVLPLIFVGIAVVIFITLLISKRNSKY